MTLGPGEGRESTVTENQNPPPYEPPGQPAEPAPPPPPPPVAPSPADPKEVEEGKVFAILSYALSFIGIPFFLVPLIMRNNHFSLYHAKQCLMIWIAGLAVSIVGGALTVICIGVVILVAGLIFLLVLDVIGLINAINGVQKPIPLIGQWGEDWFKGLQKQ